jgi:glc operon protein GlcG
MKPSLSLDHADAQLAIEAIKNEMLKRGKAAVIAVADPHGELIALLRVDGAPFTSIQIAANKAYTAARDRKPSRQIGQSSRDPLKGFDISYYGDPKIVGWGGGLPVEINGVVVGSIGVSGLPELEDIEMSQIGIDALIARDSSRSS